MLDSVANSLRIEGPEFRRHSDATRKDRHTIANLCEDGGVNRVVQEGKELKEAGAAFDPGSEVGCREQGCPRAEAKATSNKRQIDLDVVNALEMSPLRGEGGYGVVGKDESQ
jgi:hypothetical protein